MAHSILVVDDDIAVKNSMEEYLKTLKYKVKTTENAKEALDTLQIFNADIVITDIMIKGMDGLELTRKIKSKYDADVMVVAGYSAEYSYKDAIQAGASDFIFKPFRFEELEFRINRVLLEAEVKKKNAHRLEKLKTLAITDALTKLYNSRHLFSEIKTEIKRNKRYSHNLSLLILDIDFFKDYNDKWGHVEGDKVLKGIGRTIKSCMRSMDTAYRYGGDEFAILLPETGIKKACVVGSRIRNNISELVFEPEPGVKKSVKMSIGVTELVDGEDYRTFIKRADKALYQSKESGRDKLCYLY